MSGTRIVTMSPDDEQLVEAVGLGEAMWTESPVYGHMEKDVDKMVEFAYRARADPATFFHVAVEDTGRCVGFLIGGLAQYGFHDSKYAFDRLVYVTPDARGAAVASVLIAAFEDWALGHGAARIILGITTGVHTEATERLYHRLGYQTVGRLTMKEMD